MPKSAPSEDVTSSPIPSTPSGGAAAAATTPTTKLTTVWVLERHAPAWRWRRCLVEESHLLTEECGAPNSFRTVLSLMTRSIFRVRGNL